LFAVFVDYANLAGSNAVVDTSKGLCCAFIESDGAPPMTAGPSGSGLERDNARLEYSTGAVVVFRGFCLLSAQGVRRDAVKPEFRIDFIDP
jgi:hypothetical protein